jgi:Flp pilus assembly protein TadD
MFRRATILSSDDPTIREHLAMALFYNRQYSESAEILSDLVTNEAFSHRPDLLMTLGQCQLETEQVSQAAANLESASEMMPQSAGVWLELARAQMQLNNLRRAEYALGRSLAIDNIGGQGWLLMGYLRLRQSRFTEAYDAFEHANRADPSDPLNLCMLGLALDKLGRADEAATYYRQALRIDPRDEMASQLMAGLNLHE